MSSLSVFPVILVLVGIMIMVLVRKALHMKKLVNQGVSTKAEVYRHLTFTHTGAARLKIQYQFQVANKWYRSSAYLSPDDAQFLEKEKCIEIVYLPSNPKICALAKTVEQARKAVKPL